MPEVVQDAQEYIGLCLYSEIFERYAEILFFLPNKVVPSTTGVSIIFKIRVFYKAQFEGFEFFIRWPYAVFYKMQVVFYKSAHFMYF